jgi:hypothetical protein
MEVEVVLVPYDPAVHKCERRVISFTRRPVEYAMAAHGRALSGRPSMFDATTRRSLPRASTATRGHARGV